MLTATGISLAEAEMFIYAEARLADEHDYDGWEALWADDALYWVPAGPAVPADPDSRISVICDNRQRIGLRVAQLKTGKRHSQDPVSSVARIIGNVEIIRSADQGVDTRATFQAIESRARGLTTWAGKVEHRLVRTDQAVRMARKTVTLVNRDRPLPTLSFLI